MNPAYLDQLKSKLALSKTITRKIATYLERKEEIERKLPDEGLSNSQVYLLLHPLGNEFLLLLEAKWERILSLEGE